MVICEELDTKEGSFEELIMQCWLVTLNNNIWGDREEKPLMQ